MKLLFLTAEGFDTPNPNNQMAETMLCHFLNSGYHVHLIQSHRKGIQPDLPASLEKAPNLECDTVTRHVVDKTHFIRRYLNDSRYALQALPHWLKDRDADVIYLQSNPTILFPMLLLKLLRPKTPIVYSIYDVFPGHAYDIGVIRNRAIYEILRWMQKPCYFLADRITVLSEDMAEKVIAQGAKREKLAVVPAWFDVSTAREVLWEENRFVQKYGLAHDKFRVQFAGSLGFVFDYEAVLEIAQRLLNDTDIEIQIVGEGNCKEIFQQKAQERGLHNIVFYPLQPVEIVPDVYSAADLGIIPLRRGVIGNGVPSKAGILMACRRVILSCVEADSEYARMFARENMGVAMDIGDYDGTAEAIRRLSRDQKKLSEMAENAYRYGQKNYSSTRSIQKLMNVMENCADKDVRK